MDVKSGRIGKQNMFVRPGFEIKPGVDIFYVMLSGLTTAMLRLDNDVYLINDLCLDVRFMNHGKKKTAPGLYQVEKMVRHQDSGKDAGVQAGHLKPPAFAGGRRENHWVLNLYMDPPRCWLLPWNRQKTSKVLPGPLLSMDPLLPYRHSPMSEYPWLSPGHRSESPSLSETV
jgi:hypothetical protein